MAWFLLIVVCFSSAVLSAPTTTRADERDGADEADDAGPGAMVSRSRKFSCVRYSSKSKLGRGPETMTESILIIKTKKQHSNLGI